MRVNRSSIGVVKASRIGIPLCNLFATVILSMPYSLHQSVMVWVTPLIVYVRAIVSFLYIARAAAHGLYRE